MTGTGLNVGCMVGMSGTAPADLTTMTCLCDRDRCNGLSAMASAGSCNIDKVFEKSAAYSCVVSLLLLGETILESQVGFRSKPPHPGPLSSLS